jgi:hypothetical protein
VYLTIVILLMAALPLGSIGFEHYFVHSPPPLWLLMGKWFVFWSAGVRLVLAGLKQFLQPRFTAEDIFGIANDEVLPLVRELGVANFATGVVGVASLVRPSFVLPVAISAGIFYGVAGIRHLAATHRTGNEDIAMWSDLFVFLIFAVFVGFAAIA